MPTIDLIHKAAIQLATQARHAEVDFVHYYLADLADQDSVLAGLLRKGSKSVEELRRGLQTKLQWLEETPESRHPRKAKSVQDVFNSLERGVAESGHNLERAVDRAQIGRTPGTPLLWEPVLGAMLDYRPHLTVPLIGDFGLSGSALESPTRQHAPATSGGLAPNVAKASGLLAQYCVDLSELAIAGRMGEVIGRDAEIRQLALILARKESNNAILLGEAGVGKTKIVEGLALKITQSDSALPQVLRGKRILSMDLGLIIAGASYLGEFQDRLKGVLRELSEARGQYILFIDEIHQLLGLGKTSGAMDAANLLKPALARGELWCVGATTFDEYRHIEADAALRRRFQPVQVREQSMDEVQDVLQKVAPTFEQHHGVRYAPEAIAALPRLARRYLGEIRSPAREVGLLDELGAEAAMMTPADPAAANPPLPQVTRADVATLIGVRTGIPVDKLGEDRWQKTALNLEARLNTRVFGQTAVIAEVAAGLKRSLAGLSHPGRPRAIFFFAGPSGVGKTELAKVLAEELYDSPDSLIRLDMSEFNAETARNRLIGSDPGYVGYEEGGRLTEAIRRRPYSLVLLDEIEKAHPSIWRLLLQVLDDGRLTDAKGRTVSFADTVIVMTSNAGSSWLHRAAQVFATARNSENEQSSAITDGFPADHMEAELNRLALQPDESTYTEVTASLVRHSLLNLPGFPLELLSRIGDALVFRKLEPEHLSGVLAGLLRELIERVAESRGVALPTARTARDAWFHLEFTGGALRARCANPKDPIQSEVAIQLDKTIIADLVAKGDDPLLGARSLRVAFSRLIENAVANELLSRGASAEPIAIQIGHDNAVYPQFC